MQADLILQSLEACSICLRIVLAPGMPKQIFREDIMELTQDLTRFQLLHEQHSRGLSLGSAAQRAGLP